MTGERTRILIVDDEESIRRGLRAWLEDEGFEVMTAKSGEKALEILQSDPADGAVVDIRLPGMDGNAFMEQAHRLCPQMRFLIYTGTVNYSVPPDLEQLGVAKGDVLHKPLSDMSVLVAALRGRISR